MATLPRAYEYSGSSDPAGNHSPDFDAPTSDRTDYEAAGLAEYTQRHRDAWPLLLRSADAEQLRATDMTSWLRLWGRLGAELFQCFRMGDAHIRTDMVNLARDLGGWRGRMVAASLDRWRRSMGDC